MKKIYFILINLIALFVLHAKAQTTGDICSNPITQQLCGAAPSVINTNNFNNNVSTWQVGTQQITAKGQDIFYQINLPSSSYQPVNLYASLAGYFNNGCTTCSGTIYFLWFESNPCSSNPLAVDSFYISGISNLQDSLFVTYPVGSVQSQYYLVIDFNGIVNYNYTLQFGFSNNQAPPTPVCTPGSGPYKGTVALDSSKCYTSGSPYHLPLSSMNENPSYTHILLPPNNNPNPYANYLSINDDNGNGFILDLKRTDTAQQEAYIFYDSFPYSYAKNSFYDVALTVFLKNIGGASGLKGFRIRAAGSNDKAPLGLPNGTEFYNAAGSWVVNFDPNTSTYTWLFNSSNGRGDNINNNGYGCQVYTFDGEFHNLGDSIQAWYLPDNYGNDSMQCSPGSSNPPRTDCGLSAGNYVDGWIPIGINGGKTIMTGQSCGTDSSFVAGTEVIVNGSCNNYLYGGNIGTAGKTYTTPYVSYDENGCPSESDPVWTQEFPNFQSSNMNNESAFFCKGSVYNLNFSGNGTVSGLFTPSYLTYSDTYNGEVFFVDAEGNIIGDSTLGYGYITDSLPQFPVYPNNGTGGFTIPLHVPGTYELFFTNSYKDPFTGTTYYISFFCASETLYLTEDSLHLTFSLASGDTICNGSSLDIKVNPLYYYTWNPGTAIYNRNNYTATATPNANTTYTVIVADGNGCEDTANYIVNVTNCGTTAGFISPDTSCNLCVTYTDTSVGSIISWQWVFNGGNPASYNGQFPPQVCYSDTGTYQTQLIVSDGKNNDTAMKAITIRNCNPTAAFTIINDTICDGNCITIVNHSTKATSWRWTFIGGSTPFYNGMNPPAICYFDSGHYIVRLIATNSSGNDTATYRVIVKGCNNPVAGFIVSDTICGENCILYTNASSINSTSWQWSFPGGKPSSYIGENPPIICYDSIGVFTTQLAVSNNSGKDTAIKNIVVIDCSAAAAFSMSDDSICLHNCITITNTSPASDTSWQWHFPGGSPASYDGEFPPQVCYNSDGNYVVQLIAYNHNGYASMAQIITVTNCTPGTLFSTAETKICQGSCINFNNLSSGNPTSWNWYFEGGVPDSFKGINPPSICYNDSGSYSVTLIATNTNGSDTLFRPDYIKVAYIPQPIITQKGDTLFCSPSPDYQWFYNHTFLSGATSNFYIPRGNGLYSVEVANNFDCLKTDSVQVIDTRISSIGNESDFTISPNPNDGKFQVSGFRFQVEDLEVYNVLGEIIDTRHMTQDARLITIDLSNQPDGVYFVRVQMENGMVMKKVVKN